MVFESLVVDLINKYLGDYIAKLDKSQLKLGLLGGNAVLENLDIKENAFDKLDLPVKVVQGHIGKLTLKIPWKHLYSEPVIAELDGLYVLVIPNSGVKYDKEKDRAYKLEAKLKELTAIEEAKAKRNEQKKDGNSKDSFGEKFAAQVVKNLQINISNIHIRYEDAFSNPQRPFAVGVTLANLSFQTCDSTGTSIVIKEDTTREFFKSVKMDSLALYWKSEPIIFNGLTRGLMKNAMKGTISSCDNKVLDLNYLIRPISCSSMMHIHMKPEETDFTIPQLSLNLTMDQIGFGFSRSQYCDLVTFLDSIDRVCRRNKYLKYRPSTPIHGNLKTWWQFPYNVIMKEQVQRRRRMWSWEHISYHRGRCRTYTDLWVKKLLEKKLTGDEQKLIQSCEEELDLLNITVCRQQAEVKVKKAKKKLNDEKSSSGGWFTGWFGKSESVSTSSSISASDDDIKKKVSDEFTQEEKTKLYQAIGYSEQNKDPDTPKEYVSLKLNIVLHKLTLLLSDDSLSEKKLVKFSIHSLSADVEQRSSANAVKVGLVLSSMQVTGSMHADGVIPMLVSTQRASQGDNLLIIDVETNPLDQTANQKINIRAEPLEIIYDSDTINRLVKFVTPPEELRLQEISNQVAASLEDVKEMTATGLRHLAGQRMYTDIKVDIKPSYFILPQGGSYKKDCKMLLVDLGSITVRSECTSTTKDDDTNKMTKDGKLDYDKIKETAYDNFRISMSTIQVLLIEQGEDWRTLRCMELTNSHLLKPFGLNFKLKKCAISNDINLPNIFIEGCLPSLGINISDKALQSILDLILHVPFPKTDPPKVMPVKEEILMRLDYSPLGIMGIELSGNQVLRATDLLPDSETASTVSTMDGDNDQFYEANDNFDNNGAQLRRTMKASGALNPVDVEMVFTVTMIELQVFEDTKQNASVTSDDRKEIVKLIIDAIGISFTMKRFDINFQAHVGSLMLAVPQFIESITQLPICLLQTNVHEKNQNLLFVKLMIAEKTCPDFATFYNNTRHTLECNFRSLEICLHQEALLLLLNFSNSLMLIINTEEKAAAPNWSATVGDEQGALEATEKYETHLRDNKKVFPVTSVLNVVTDQIETNKEKRNICLDAEKDAERAGKTVYIPEITITQWAIAASLGQLHISFASDKYKNILEISVHEMSADVKITYRITEVTLSLADIKIQDPCPTAMYKEILWIDPNDSIFSANIVLFNQSTKTGGYELDLSRVDTLVQLKIGKVNVIFLYNFVYRFQEFFESFQTAMQLVMDKAQEYSEVAVQQLATVIEAPPSDRISLNIKIDAPVIHIPENSNSTNGIVIDLGSMVFKNHFKIADGTKAVIDVSTISLKNVRISRSILLANTVKNEKSVLNPINISVEMLRNLSWASYKQIPQIDIKVKMHAISVTVTQGDFSMIQKVLLSNLGEVTPDPNKSMLNKPSVEPNKQNIKDDKPLDDQVKVPETCRSELVIIQFSLDMDSMILELFKGELLPEEWSTEISAERRLTKMTCDNLLVKGKMFQDTAKEIDVRLNNIKLLDTQPGPPTKINELIKNRSKDSKDFIFVKFIQDKSGNIKLVVDIAGIFVCVCMDYLMQLMDFFVSSQLPPPQQQQQVLCIDSNGDSANKCAHKPQIVVVEPRLFDLEIDVHVEQPEILLVEDIDNPKTNALMVQMEVTLKYSLLKECEIINAEVTSLQATFCPFNVKKRQKYSMDIISPTNVALYCNRPINDGMQGSLTMEHLIVNITPAVIQSVSKIMAGLNTTTNNKVDDLASTMTTSINSVDSHHNEDYWQLKKFEDKDFPFIVKGLLDTDKEDKNDMIVESGYDIARKMSVVEQRRADQRGAGDEPVSKIYIRLPDIRIVLESEVAKKCVPMLIVECSVDGDMKDPMTQLKIELTVAVSLSYFNDNINVWEPLVEVYLEDNKRQYCFEFKYTTRDDTQLICEDELDDIISVESSAVSIELTSRDDLELTLSKTALDVITKLGKAFEDAYLMNLDDHKSVVGAPYLIKNTCGLDIVLYLNDDFDLKVCMNDEEKKVIVKNNGEIKLCDAKTEKTLITEEKKARLVQLALSDSPSSKQYLSIHKSETRALYVGSRDSETQKSHEDKDRDMGLLIAQTTAYLGMKNLDLRSVLQVHNHSEDELSLHYKRRISSSQETIFIDTVPSGQTFNVPIPVLRESDGQVYISAPSLKTSVSTSAASWNKTQANQILECATDSGTIYYYSISVIETSVPLNSPKQEEELIHTYTINICAPVSLHNQLPIPIGYLLQMFSDKVQPGSKTFLRTASLDKQSTVKINYEYEKREWFGTLELRAKMDEFGVITFKAKDGFNQLTMELGVRTIVQVGEASVTLYSPYWMINKTGHTLSYKVGDEHTVSHEADNRDAVLFSFLSNSIFSKKHHHKLNTDIKKTSLSQHNLQSLQTDDSTTTTTSNKVPQPIVDTTDSCSNNGKFAKTVKAHLKVDNSSWSDKFSLDTVGSNGKIICKQKPLSYEVSVNISLSSCGLTKIVTFMPYYMIINHSSIPLSCKEELEGAEHISVPPGEAVPFWPRSEVGKSMLMRCMVEDRDTLMTQPFPFFESHSILLKLDHKFVGIFVDVQITEEANLITLQLYQVGMALVQLVNHLGDNVNIYYKQSGSNQELMLPSHHTVMYAWQDSRQKKELQWRVDGDTKKPHSNTLTADSIGNFDINKSPFYWVSSVLDMHRILLFTNNKYVAKRARVSTDLEMIDMEVTISLHSIRLSIVDNSIRQELAYVSITSSGIKWNQLRKHRWKPLNVAQSEALEVAYDEYLRKCKVGELTTEEYIVKVDDLEVDLNKNLMLKPEKTELRRVFEPGVYLQYRTSTHQMHVHLRVYRIQVDNQMDDCTFPVVFAPFPPPRSVTLEMGLKPLIEVSAVIGKTSDGSSMRFKYFKVLIQEMQLMLDQGFLNAMLDFLSSTVADVNEEEMFKMDSKLIDDRLINTPTINAILQGGKKNVFDNFHISSIKIHLSFSLSRGSSSGKTALHSEVLNVFLQSVGVVVTDMQDVIFKLAYFEKQNSIMPMNQMIAAMTRHYVSQGLRQMYVLVLGLDVIGNPFGVIRGMAQGVEDLFYEPVRGAIMGPEEFVDGVAYGVKSLFGHAVGGAAGAVSRIVGTMGKGIAALTLDEDYQKKRREQMSRKPDNVGVGLAQGGKGIVMGIFQGVTGVVTKPIDGAKKEGVEGFFKGVGKGLVGVVTRPVSGVVDFASSSFDGIRRVADTNIEVYRIRPPRFISKDGVIRNYGLREAEGNVIWKKLVEKSESLAEEVYVFHISCRPKKHILFLTNFRVLYLDRNEILASWSINWQVSYHKLDGLPTINEARKVIVFSLKEKQRKIFSKDNITKEIEGDVSSLKVIITKVTTIFNEMDTSKTK